MATLTDETFVPYLGGSVEDALLVSDVADFERAHLPEHDEPTLAPRVSEALSALRRLCAREREHAPVSQTLPPRGLRVVPVPVSEARASNPFGLHWPSPGSAEWQDILIEEGRLREAAGGKGAGC